MKEQGTSKEMAAPKLTHKELETLLRAEFPEMFSIESGYALENFGMAVAVCAGISIPNHCGRVAPYPGRS
jgi:hypothetical protein